jgi:hypothetical protein
LPNRAGSNLRPDVHEEDHVRGGLGHARVDSNRLAAVLGQDNGLEKRMPLAGEQFRCAVGRTVRDNDDLLDVGVIEVQKMLNLTREQRDAVMHGEYYAHIGGDRSRLPGPRPNPRQHPHRHGVSHVGVENADQRKPEDNLHWAPLLSRIVLTVSNMMSRSKPSDRCLT